MQLCFLSGLASAEWAAWVQAIGSILAIAAAIAIASHQTTRARQLERERQADRIRVVIRLLNYCSSSMLALRDLWLPLAGSRSDGIYWPARGQFKDAAYAVKNIALAEVPTEAVIEALMEARRGISRVERWANLVPDARPHEREAFDEVESFTSTIAVAVQRLEADAVRLMHR